MCDHELAFYFLVLSREQGNRLYRASMISYSLLPYILGTTLPLWNFRTASEVRSPSRIKTALAQPGFPFWVWGLRGVGFKGLGFRGLGFKGLGYRV